MKKKSFSLCSSILLLFTLFTLSLGAETTSDPLIIANSATWPPFSFLDDNGQPQGLLIDLWNEWARKNNYDVEFMLVDWNESLELIRTKVADIHAGLFETENRKSYMVFSDELFQLTARIFISNQLRADSVEELKKLNLKVGVVKGSKEEEFTRSHFPYLNLRLFNNNKQLAQSATTGKTSVFVADYPTGMYYLHHFGIPDKFRILATLYSQSLHSAVKKGNTELLTIVNNGFLQINKNEKERILQKWIRSEEVLPSWLMPALTIGVICISIFGLSLYIYFLSKHKRDLEIQVANRTTELIGKNVELEKAVKEIKQLSGMLPICASCKKIRDDKGYWKQIETYISEHSEAQFSHSICPECAQKLYPEFYTKV
ncbi:MAG: transporter substrate-binding domain-containing protein [Deltaproteobacteria bacterium]|nr:transporter substrate-binding domain-containing protein [Deltaproteobacteria bacterium]